jgi:hypothetical protein
MSNLSSQPEDFFSFILISSPIKTLSLVICSIAVIGVPILSYGVIWYDRNGPDKKRTFLNRLVVFLCYALVEMFLTIQLTEIIRQCYRPMPKLYCHIKAIARPMYITQLLLYLDAMAISRYLFIFVLKNPAAFPDNFWIRYVNIWIKSACFIGNNVWSYMAEHEVLNYYICSGEDPTEDFKRPLKSYGFVETVSILIYLFVFVRIQVFKHTRKSQLAVTHSCFIKSQYLEEINALSLKTFLVNVAGLAIFVMLLGSTMVMNRIKPNELQNHKTFIHVHYLVSLSLPSLVYLIIYYIQHEEIGTFVWNNHPLVSRLFKKAKK